MRYGDFASGFLSFKLLKRFTELIHDEVLRAGLAHKLDDMELIAGDDRVVRLAHIADLGDYAAQLVVALYRFQYLFLGKVDAVDLGKRRYDLLLDLTAEVSGVPLALLDRHIYAGDKELFVRNDLAILKILLHAVHGGAAFLTYQCGEEVVASLKCALKDTLGVRA